MKPIKTALLFSSIFILAACVNPQQRAEQRLRAEQNLQVALAKQCDLETAELMAQQFNPPVSQTAEQAKLFEKRYVEKVNNPMFQACYKMAWQNYKSQQEMQEMRDWYYRDNFRPWFPCFSCW